MLIRHAEAEFTRDGGTDFERELTTNGVNQAVILGTYLNKVEVQPQVIYQSPSARTKSTSSHIIQQMDKPPRLMNAEELYEATENLMKAFVSRIDPMYDHVAILAHNPAIGQLFAYLTLQVRPFSTATCATLSFEVDEWMAISGNSGTQLDFYYPGMVNA